jgi:hypothetical protein
LGISPLVAVVCLVMFALMVVVQVAHLHANTGDADRCPLCIVMHSAAPVDAAAAAVVLVPLESIAPTAEARAVIRNWSSKLFARAPPAGC